MLGSTRATIPVDAEILAASTERSGAVVMGRNLFDVIDAPSGWSDDMGYGAQHVARPPFFVVTHEPPANVRLKLDLRFVADVPTAIEQAKAVAGDKDVFVMGGGEIIRQSVDAGLVDELVLHLSPVVLGAGTPLFVDATRRGSCSDRSDRPARPSTSPTTCARTGSSRGTARCVRGRRRNPADVPVAQRTSRVPTMPASECPVSEQYSS